MAYDPQIHHRRSIRLREHDYSWVGWYYVTICTYQRQCSFGKIDGDVVRENNLGRIVRGIWVDLPNRYPIELDEFIIMPNHVHGIIIIKDSTVGAIHESPLRADRKSNRRKMLLSKIIGRFKMTSAKRINLLRNSPGIPVWQRGFYEHVIRNEADLHRIRQYIQNNPFQWALDEENPENHHPRLLIPH